MKISELEVFLNYGQLLVGSDREPGFDLLVSAPPASDAYHVALTTRAQIAPVRVSIWRGTAPKTARQIFTGEVVLSTGYIALREASDPPFFVWPACVAGAQVKLSVGVDSRPEATAVTVVIDPSAEVMPDVRSRGNFVASVAEITSLSRIDRVLAGYNYPVDRIAAAVRIMRSALGGGVSDSRIQYGVASVVEWLKWLHPAILAADLGNVSQRIYEIISGSLPDGEAARALVDHVASSLGLSVDEFLMTR